MVLVLFIYPSHGVLSWGNDPVRGRLALIPRPLIVAAPPIAAFGGDVVVDPKSLHLRMNEVPSVLTAAASASPNMRAINLGSSVSCSDMRRNSSSSTPCLDSSTIVRCDRLIRSDRRQECNEDPERSSPRRECP
jgi:hypothetical protein